MTNSQEKKEGECDCKEMSCTKNCSRNHTHKGFFCEICEPEATAKMRGEVQPKIEKNEEWEGELKEKMREWGASGIPSFLIPFIKSLIKKKEEGLREKIKRVQNYAEIRENEGAQYAQGHQKAIDDILFLLEQDKKI